MIKEKYDRINNSRIIDWICMLLITVNLVISLCQSSDHSYPDMINILTIISLWLYFFKLKPIAFLILIYGLYAHCWHIVFSGCSNSIKTHTFSDEHSGYKITGEYRNEYRHDTIAGIDTLTFEETYTIYLSKIKHGEWSYYDSAGRLCAVQKFGTAGLESTQIYFPIDSSVLAWTKFDSVYNVFP